MLTFFERTGIIWNSVLSPEEKLILLCLNQFIDGEGTCFPAKSKIMQMTSMKPTTLKKVFKELNESGILISNPRFRENNSQTTHLRKIVFEVIPQESDPNPQNGGSHYDRGGVGRRPGGGRATTGGRSGDDPLLIDQFKRLYDQSEEKEDLNLTKQDLSISGKSTQHPPTHSSQPESNPNPDPWDEGDRSIQEINSQDHPKPTQTPFLLSKDLQPFPERNSDFYSSAAASQKSPPPKSAKTPAVDVEVWKKIHNDYRPASWPSVQDLTSKQRLDAIRALIGHYKGQEQALEAYKVVLTYIRTKDDWWASHAITFDNLTRKTKGHVIGLYEKALQAKIQPMPREISPEQKEAIRQRREIEAEQKRIERQARIDAERKELLAQLSRNATA